MTKHAKMQLAAMILLPLALAGCDKSVRGTPVPPELTTCADEPVAPDLPGREQQAVRDTLTLDYILSLRSAWGDCRSKVDGTRAWSKRIAQ